VPGQLHIRTAPQGEQTSAGDETGDLFEITLQKEGGWRVKKRMGEQVNEGKG
jgi:hypothetical protein